MRQAKVFFDEALAGYFTEISGKDYLFQYESDYNGPPISLTMPVRRDAYSFDSFPPFFDGLLPEGFQLEALLRQKKLDHSDRFGQLLVIGSETVGAVTVIGDS